MKIRFKTFTACIALPLAVGGLSAFLTKNSMNTFKELKKPPFSPPGWLFPIVWTILFVCMGIASYRIVLTEWSRDRSKALMLYGIQLAVNFVWPLLFFRAEKYVLSFACLALLWYLVYECHAAFRMISGKAAALLVPYLVWLTYAGYLNFGICVLNRGK